MRFNLRIIVSCCAVAAPSWGSACDTSSVAQAIDRAILAEEQQFVLAAEVVVKVAWRQIGGDRDVTHAGGGKTADAEDPRGGAHDRDPASLGAE